MKYSTCSYNLLYDARVFMFLLRSQLKLEGLPSFLEPIPSCYQRFYRMNLLFFLLIIYKLSICVVAFIFNTIVLVVRSVALYRFLR